MYDFHIQFYRGSADMSLKLYFLLENEGSPKPLGNPKWKKGHNFPLFIGSMAKGAAPDFDTAFSTGRGNLGRNLMIWEHFSLTFQSFCKLFFGSASPSPPMGVFY